MFTLRIPYVNPPHSIASDAHLRRVLFRRRDDRSLLRLPVCQPTQRRRPHILASFNAFQNLQELFFLRTTAYYFLMVRDLRAEDRLRATIQPECFVF